MTVFVAVAFLWAVTIREGWTMARKTGTSDLAVKAYWHRQAMESWKRLDERLKRMAEERRQQAATGAVR